MNNEKSNLSVKRLKRLRAQGYVCESDQQLSEMAFGIRFPYRLCVLIIIAAIATQSIILFSAMLLIAILGVLLPYHPFDYIYNYLLSGLMDKPALPPRSKQLKFACSIASTWLAVVVYLLAAGNVALSLTLAGMLAGVALLPSTIDLCIPSLIYNALFTTESEKLTKNLTNS